MKVTIDRSRWYRGQGSEDSRLVTGEERKCCCLGFYCLALGFTEAELIDVSLPSKLYNYNEPLTLRPSADFHDAVCWNDATHYSWIDGDLHLWYEERRYSTAMPDPDFWWNDLTKKFGHDYRARIYRPWDGAFISEERVSVPDNVREERIREALLVLGAEAEFVDSLEESPRS